MSVKMARITFPFTQLGFKKAMLSQRDLPLLSVDIKETAKRLKYITKILRR